MDPDLSGRIQRAAIAVLDAADAYVDAIGPAERESADTELRARVVWLRHLRRRAGFESEAPTEPRRRPK